MKKILLLPLLLIFFISCKKDNPLLLPEYQNITGTWNIISFTFDSSGISVTKSLPYNRLKIIDNLEYEIFRELINPIENGRINIITQNNNKLELYFAARYPDYSSMAGSHVFGITNVELVSLSDNKMIIKTVNAGNADYSDRQIYFIRQLK